MSPSHTPEEQALNQPILAAAQQPLPPDVAAGVPIAPPVDNAGGALPPELLQILMLNLGGGGGEAQAGGGAVDPILGALLGAQAAPAGLDGQAIGGPESLPPIDDVVQ